MKGNSLFSKYILFILGIISLMPGMAYSQTFKHYQGIANKAGDYEVIDAANDCLRQKTHVYDYYIALPSGGSKELSLPFSGYSGNGTDLEPRGYFRWYNYDTDKASAQLKAYSASGKLQSMKDDHGIDKGLIAYNLLSKPNRNLVGAVYTRPADASWSGETIACDVSRYVDGCSGTSFEHEPTLSIRYIFHIMPAEKMADDIKQKLLETGRDRDYTYEDGKGVSAGLKDGEASMTLRLNLNDVTNYYFHPMNNINTHHVFAEDEAHQIKETDFTSEVVQATQVQWRVYNSDKKQFVWWTHTASNGYAPRFFDLSLNLLNKTGASAWRNLNGGGVSSKQTFKYGDRIYVVAIAVSSSGQKCPIANFTCQLFNQYPMTADELKTSGQNTRLNSYLKDHYRSVNIVSFDDDDEEQTLLAPTNPDDNQTRLPSKWSKRSYGFVYRELMNSAPAGNMYVNPKHSPLHGEYGLYKSANIKGKSGWGNSGTDSYLWWPTAQLYDRTYENTNGTQYCHFLYIDAADESRQIAEADFKADLCVGSQVIFSAAIADMTTGSQRPQLLFKLYGMNYDENNQETERRLLHSFSSGNFSGNREGTDAANVGKWYQVYGKMVLQKESGVNNFTDFKLVVDNMCKSTSGADYAFDDLRIYTKSSKVDIIQSSPICPDKNTAEDSSVSSNILTKLRALQETMAALIAPATEKKLYFRFVDAEGNPAKNVNYGTAENPNYQWGTTTIYNYVDDTRKVDGKPMYEKINDEWYVVLANRYFNLQSNQTYYVSFAFEDETVEDKNQLSWGKPSDVCSLYSTNFQMVQQKVLVTDANGSITTTVTIPCDDNDTPKYNIKAQLQTVDQNNGGSIQLNGVFYDWYVDDATTPILKNSAEFKDVRLGVGDHTIRVVPTNTSGTINQGGVDYQICLGEMSFKLRVVKNGPQLDLGRPGVAYPNNYARTVRIGLPQVALLAEQEAKGGGYFSVPISGENLVADNSTRLYFVKAGGKDHLDPSQYTNVMYLSDTNDPAYQNRIGESLTLATLQDNYIMSKSSQLKLKFTPQSGDASSASKNVQLHEGYWYEGVLIFRENGTTGTTVLCSGEVYIRFAVVPEYATWNPTANSRMSAAWNNDENWRRSGHGELYKGADEYTDYSSGGYVPMKFTKVTIPDLRGLYFPSLGYIAYQKSTGIATRLSNAKGDAATANIQYEQSSLSAPVDKQNAHRLVVNADAQENALGKMNYKLVQLQDGNNYYLVGNPYMATLSMYKFLKANPSLQSGFYVYEGGVLKLYNQLDMSTTTYESKNDVKISPMQSFFVRLKGGQSASQLNFTSAMTVDREVFGGGKTASDEEQGEDNITLTLTAASASGYRSRSRIVLDASASEDYDDAEDAQLLYDAQLKEVPVVYTVAGDEAVALNTLPDVDWLPLGVVGKSSSVGLKIDGLSRLSSPLYLYDAATRKYQELKEEEEVKVQANEHGRYFLTQTRSTTGIEDAEVGESDVKIYSPARGLIVVSKVNGPLLNKVEVYTLDGKLVAAKKAAGAVSVSIPVSSSSQTVYIIRVSLMDTQTVITKKLSLR